MNVAPFFGDVSQTYRQIYNHSRDTHNHDSERRVFAVNEILTKRWQTLSPVEVPQLFEARLTPSQRNPFR